MPRAALVKAMIVVVASAASAQQTPVGWRWALDRPAANVMAQDILADAWRFQEVIPGMHVTTGPGVVVLAPGDAAAGRFSVDADIVLFPDSRDSSGYGIAFGASVAAEGTEVQASTWYAFLVSGEGRYCLVRHAAGATTLLLPWQAHDAIRARGRSTITNRLRVAVEPDSVRLIANGKPVATVPRAGLSPDGGFGLRLDGGLNVHVTNVDITRRLLKRTR